MKLFGESEGAGVPVVILHGLLGSCENWRHIRSALADRFRVIGLDLPNHGHSPHTPRMSLHSIVEDVEETLREQGVEESVYVIGHSLGGRVAMRWAADRPARVRGLAVVDISPRALQPAHLFVLRACQALDPASATRRSELDAALAQAIPQAETRAFLLKNVVRDALGRLAWRVPLAYLIDNYRIVSDAMTFDAPYAAPALFVAGGASSFRLWQDEALIRQSFPAARLVTIPGAGHWVQTDQPAAFLDAVRAFFK